MYLKDSNAASHFVNSLILFALSRTAWRHFFAHAMQKNVSNRWYASALRVRKSQNGSGFKVHLNPKYFFRLNKSLHLFETHFAFLNLILTFL